jgi:crotonobetainyl-CoA:carnitine CoA-transferase CaiB-like acyl-CoA transferase
MVVELDGTPQLGTPIKLRNHPASVRTPAPRLGDATREILSRPGPEPAP